MGKCRAIAWGGLVICLLGVSGVSSAQDATVVTRTFPNPNPPLGEAVGSITTDVTCPAVRVFSPGDTNVGRSVRVTLSKPGTGYRDVINLILLGGAMTAFQACPMAHTDGENQVPDRTVDFLDVFESPTDGAPVAQVLHAEHFANDAGQWATITDILAQNTASVAPSEEPPPAPVQPPVLQPQQQAVVPSAVAPSNAPAATGGDPFEGLINGLFQLIADAILLALALWAAFNWANILRFIYGLTPHPAADEINAVIHFGKSYDPDRLAHDLAIVPWNSIEREVRTRQARELLQSLNAHLKRTRAKLDEETEILKGQAELVEGMEMHERIKRRLDAILRAQGKIA